MMHAAIGLLGSPGGASFAQEIEEALVRALARKRKSDRLVRSSQNGGLS